MNSIKRAVFIDRDGVLNDLVFNPKTECYESPHEVKDLTMMPTAFSGLKLLQENGFELFIVSNQPSYAKGKTSLENIQEIASEVRRTVQKHSINVKECFYCYHHPDGIAPEYSGPCEC